MRTTAPFNKLSGLIKSFSSDYNVWITHAANKDKIEYKCGIRINDLDSEIIEADIDSLNSIHNTNELRNSILNKYENFSDKDINNFIFLIEDYKNSSCYISHDFSDYKTNQRLLNFALFNILNDGKFDEFNVKEIKNDYLRLIYIYYVLDPSDYLSRKIERIEKDFSDIMIDKALHFKKYDHVDFYKWALKYMQADRRLSRRYNLARHSPIHDDEFKITVLSVFDQIYVTDSSAYSLLKDKISNAWYQKAYRQKNKGKKYRYFFTDKVNESLKIMAVKEDLTEEKMLEKLINQHYATFYINQLSGKDLYSLAR